VEEYGVDEDFIVTGINAGKLEYREGGKKSADRRSGLTATQIPAPLASPRAR
jgi:hypothetical protein